MVRALRPLLFSTKKQKSCSDREAAGRYGTCNPQPGKYPITFVNISFFLIRLSSAPGSIKVRIINGAMRAVVLSRCTRDIALKDCCPSCVRGLMLMTLTSALVLITVGSHSGGYLSFFSSVLRVMTACSISSWSRFIDGCTGCSLSHAAGQAPCLEGLALLALQG